MSRTLYVLALNLAGAAAALLIFACVREATNTPPPATVPASGHVPAAVLRGSCVRMAMRSVETDGKPCEDEARILELSDGRIRVDFALKNDGGPAFLSFVGGALLRSAQRGSGDILVVDRVRFVSPQLVQETTASGGCAFFEQVAAEPLSLFCDAQTHEGRFYVRFLTTGTPPWVAVPR